MAHLPIWVVTDTTVCGTTTMASGAGAWKGSREACWRKTSKKASMPVHARGTCKQGQDPKSESTSVEMKLSRRWAVWIGRVHRGLRSRWCWWEQVRGLSGPCLLKLFCAIGLAERGPEMGAGGEIAVASFSNWVIVLLTLTAGKREVLLRLKRIQNLHLPCLHVRPSPDDLFGLRTEPVLQHDCPVGPNCRLGHYLELRHVTSDLVKSMHRRSMHRMLQRRLQYRLYDRPGERFCRKRSCFCAGAPTVAT